MDNGSSHPLSNCFAIFCSKRLYSECSAKYSALPQTRGATHQVKQLLAHRLVIQAELQLRVQCADLHREHFTRLLSSKQAHF